MKLELRLDTLFQEKEWPDHGAIEEIAKYTGLHRHTVAGFFRGQVESPSLQAIEKICEWLSQVKGVHRDDLPQALFCWVPTSLWQAVGCCDRVRFYIGQYEQADTSSRRRSWISYWDFNTAREFEKLLNVPRDPNRFRIGHIRRDQHTRVGNLKFDIVPIPFSSATEVRDVASDEGPPSREDVTRSRRELERIRERTECSACVLIGSMKSNLLVEHYLADLFGYQAFGGRRDDHPAEIPPFFLKLRDDDRYVRSSFCGKNPPPEVVCKSSGPGVYYWTGAGSYEYCPWSQDKDCGIIIVVNRHPVIEMVLCGFSGRATHSLVHALDRQGDALWKPTVDIPRQAVKVGIFVCSLDYSNKNEPCQKVIGIPWKLR